MSLLITRVDSPKAVIMATEQRGVYSCGYHVDEQSIAPKGFLTGVEWNVEVTKPNTSNGFVGLRYCFSEAMPEGLYPTTAESGFQEFCQSTRLLRYFTCF
ncbi:MAG: hypothetical protein ACFE0I_12810 [Elainellaceae cyanobacterium]